MAWNLLHSALFAPDILSPNRLNQSKHLGILSPTVGTGCDDDLFCWDRRRVVFLPNTPNSHMLDQFPAGKHTTGNQCMLSLFEFS